MDSNNSIFAPQFLRERVSDVLGVGDPPAEVLRRALDETQQLARDAYEANLEPARRTAEVALYTINIENSFAPPSNPLLAIIWSGLMQPKLRAALRPHLVPELGVAEMKAGLERGVQEADKRDHSFIDEVVAHPDLRGLRIYTRNWFGSTHGFTSQVISVLQRASGEMQRTVLHNVEEEFRGTEHALLRARFVNRIGLKFDPRTAPDDPEQTLESLALLNYRTGIVNMRDPSFALGSFYTIEAGFPPVCARLLNGLRKRGFEEDAIETFRLHVEVDEDHAAEWMESLSHPSLGGVDRARILAGGLGQLQLRHEMFEAKRRLFASA